MGGNDRCVMYKETQSSILKRLEKGLTIDKNIYMNQLVLIKNDVSSKEDSTRRAALDMLDFLLSLNIEEIQTEVIKILHDSTVNKFIQNCVLKSIKKKITDTIAEEKFNFTEILLPWRNQNINKLTNIIEDVCLNDLPKDKCKTFFINNVIPTMMLISTNNDIRDTLTDMAFMLSTIVPISDLSSDELQMFLRNVNNIYVKSIGELRDKDYPNWHNLWIFLVRFCDKHIHSSMELTNRLLRVVEYAFRNSSIQQRLKGYDCWKELIDNASLDMNHMCSSKQIKLLITPLKAKFSKQEIVICKRFDVFTYLLEKLQHKAVLCLTEFLEFCFGPIGENKDATKTGQGKGVPQIWTKSTKVLVDIIGHSHNKSISCISTEDVIKLEKPVITYSNISSHYKVIINSVGECCALLKEVDIESKREMVIKCMWKRIFNLVIPSPDANRKKYFHVISEVLDNYIQQSRENPYFEDVILLIFTVLMSYDVEIVYEAIQYILKQLLIIIFTVDNFPVNVADTFKIVLAHSFSKIVQVENKIKVIKEIMNAFIRLKPSEDSISNISKIWLCLANELISDFTAERIEKFAEFNEFFMWPAFHLHHLDEHNKKQIVLHWMKLYRKISMDSEVKKVNVMKELEKIFKNNPLLSSDVVSLLNVMSQFENNFTKEFVAKLMNVSSLILLLPNLKTEDEQKITALVMQYFEPTLSCYQSEDSDEVVKSVCTCIEHILCIHKGYKLLDTLANFIRNSPAYLKLKFSKYLSDLVLDLYNKETDIKSYNAKELQKVLKVFNTESDNNKVVVTSPFFPPEGRSARIAKLAKNAPKSPKRRSKNIEASPTTLRLFGKDIETLSPLRVKGSQLNNTTPSKPKKIISNAQQKIKNSPSINDEKSSDFIPINTEVKFQPEKLSKHQKEVLKKRREDIPALYQDLSQSLSQDIFSSSASSSRDPDKDDKDNSADKRKVIVEVIGHHFKESAFHDDAVDMPFPSSSSVIPGILEPTAEDLNGRNKEIKTESNLSAVLAEKPLDPEETMYIEAEASVKMNEVHNKVAEHVVDKKYVLTCDILEEPQKQEVCCPKTEEEDKSLVKSADEDEKEKKRRAKIEAELQKLKMDIVGADAFFAASSRRTRSKDKLMKPENTPSKKSEDTSTKKIEQPAKVENLSPSRTHTLRKSLNVEKHEVKTEKNRRKTLGSNLDVISKVDCDIVDIKMKPLLRVPKQSKEQDQLSTPKAPRRKSLKSQVMQNKETSNEADQQHLTTKAKRQSRRVSNTTENKRGDITEIKTENQKGEKRKHSSADEESEDIIESSQEFHADVTPLFNASKRKSIIENSFEEKIDLTEVKTVPQNMDVNEQLILNSEQLTDNKDNHIKTLNINNTNGVGRVSEVEKVAEKEAMEYVHQMEEVPFHIEDVVQEVEVTDTAEENFAVMLPEDKFDEIGEMQTDVNTTQDTTLTHLSEDATQTQDLTENLSQEIEMTDVTQSLCQDMETQDTETQVTQTQDTQTQDTPSQSESCVLSEDIRPPVLYFDLPKKPELTDSERIMCQMDTMSICSDPNNLTLTNHTGDHQNAKDLEVGSEISQNILQEKVPVEDVLGTPKSKRTSSLPSSPVTVETPNRTKELLNDTLDISPINSKDGFDTDLPKGALVSVSLNFKSDMEELNPNNKEMTVLDDDTKHVNEMNENKENCVKNFNEVEIIPHLPENILRELEEEGSKQRQEETVVSYEADIPQQIDEIKLQIEKTQGIQEVPQIAESSNEYQENAQIEDEVKGESIQIEVVKHGKENGGIQERASKLLNMLNINSPLSINNKFFIKKRSSGVTMSPSTARIKRLMSNFNQKQNRDELGGEVKDEDILTFSREVPSPLAVPRSSILKRKLSDMSEPEGVSPCPKRKRVNFSDPCLTSKKVFIRDEYHNDELLHGLEAKCLFDITPEVNSKEEHHKNVFNFPDEPSNSEQLTETENIETEPSLELINPLILRKDKPIYPNLVDCDEDVLVILKRVTSPMFITTLMNKLKNKNIKTIGDMAKQSESEINRFPFRVPVVANVYKALDNYYKKNIDKFGKDKLENSQQAKINGVDEGQKSIAKKYLTSETDVKVTFKELVEKSVAEGYVEELADILLSALEKQLLISIIRRHNKIDVRDFLKEDDYKLVIRHIMEIMGLPKLFEILTESVENSEDESVYFDCMIKHSIDKKPLSNLLENRSLEEIKSGFWEIIDKKMFGKQDILETCLLPLIENPSDIYSYINKLSVVQLGDIVIRRLESSELPQFFKQIITAYDSEQVTTSLNKELIKHLSSTSDIISTFQCCINAQNKERQSEVMVEMFKFISGKLNINMLLELHVDFLKRIPSIMSSGCQEK